MDFGQLEYFESYSSYKKKCLAVLGSDRGRIRQFLQHLRNSNDRDEHLLKINVVWDTNSVARELILNDSGEVVVKDANKHMEHFLQNKNTCTNQMSAAVRLLLYIHSNLQKPAYYEPSISSNLTKLIIFPKCPLETSLLAGAALVSVTVINSMSDEDCLQSFSQFLLENGTTHNDLLQISYYYGLLTSVKPIILIGQSNLSEEQPFLFTILERVIKLCSKITKYEYHSFHLLRMWTLKFLEICSQVTLESENNYRIETSGSSLQEIIKLCKNNLENPTKGVSDLCFEALVDTLKVSHINLDEEESKTLEEDILSHTKASKWTQKTKYILLKAMLTVYGKDNILDATLPSNLTWSLTSPHLVHAGANLYSLLLTGITTEEWKATFAPVLLRSLLDEDPGVRRACLDQWLPVTIERVELAGELILQELAATQSEAALVARLSVMKIHKRLGKEFQANEVESHSFLKNCLLHASPSVRSQAFGLICDAKKKGSVPSEDERKLVLTFLSEDGSDSCAKFRQTIESSFSVLCSRCRDNGSMIFRNKLKDRDAHDLNDIIEFLDECMKILIHHLLPGGNYQRKIFSLGLLVIFTNSFFNFKTGKGSNKKSGNGDPSKFVKFANDQEKMLLFQNHHFVTLALNIKDHMSDVKEKSCEILEMFEPADKAYEELFKKMRSLIQSPKDSNCEAGSLLAKLLAKWKRRDTVSNENICDFLFEQVQNGLVKFRENFLECSRESAMYGVIMALRRCLLDHDSAERNSFSQIKLSSLVSELENISDLMLTILCGGSGSGTNPDFQKMASAINHIIANDNEDTDADDISIPEDHQLALSAAWHNLKECILMVGGLVSCLRHDTSPSPDSCDAISLEDTQRCCDLLRRVITRCRHKGVIEASNIASGQIAASLLASNISAFQQMPENILTELFQQLQSSWSQSSYTRRGAGLPGLIQKFVASEPSSRPRSLLPLTVTRLLEITALGADTGAEAEDSPASHCLHILKCLVQDASVARHIAPHITDITRACLATFASKSWSVRNAGLQLLGGLTPRIVGQKKMREDTGSYNNVAVLEVVSRFPGLVELLVAQLAASRGARGCLVAASVVPVLTVLARMESSGPDTVTEMVTNCVSNFVGSPVLTVRVLTARILSQFSPQKPVDIARIIIRKHEHKGDYTTNEQHSDLLLIHELTKRQCVEDPQTLSQLLSEIEECIHCFVLKCEVSKIQIAVQKLSQQPYTTFSTQCYNFEPGFYNWRQIFRETNEIIEETSMDTFEDANNTIDRVTQAPENLEDAVTMVERILSSDNKTVSSGHLTEKLLDYLLVKEVTDRLNPEFNNQLFNSEVALELLDSLSNEKLKQFGTTVSAKVVNLRAVCLNTMLIQDDWEWFFGDTSEYVSVMVENSEQVLELAGPRNTETQRLVAARAIAAYLPTFNQNNFTKMTLVLQFGFVNLLNASLLLLQDEDNDVRDEVMQFAYRIPRPHFVPESPCPVNREECVRRVVWCGLASLPEVADMLAPVIQTLVLPQQLTAASLGPGHAQSGLFRRGEGVNVFSENFYRIKSYFSAVNTFLENHPASIKVLVSSGNIIQNVTEILQLLEKEENISRTSRTKRGLEALSSVQAMLALTVKHNMLNQEDNKSQARVLLDQLNSYSLWKLKLL